MYKYLEIEYSHEIEYKNEKGKLKTEQLKILRLGLDTELSPNNKTKGTALLAVTLLIHIAGILSSTKRNGENCLGKQGNC